MADAGKVTTAQGWTMRPARSWQAIAAPKLVAPAVPIRAWVFLESQERESSDRPMLNAFCRVAPSVRRNFLAIARAGVFLRANVFNSRTSPAVQARRFFGLLAINPPFQERQLVSLTGANEKPTDWLMIGSLAVEPFSP